MRLVTKFPKTINPDTMQPETILVIAITQELVDDCNSANRLDIREEAAKILGQELVKMISKD